MKTFEQDFGQVRILGGISAVLTEVLCNFPAFLGSCLERIAAASLNILTNSLFMPVFPLRSSLYNFCSWKGLFK